MVGHERDTVAALGGIGERSGLGDGGSYESKD